MAGCARGRVRWTCLKSPGPSFLWTSCPWRYWRSWSHIWIWWVHCFHVAKRLFLIAWMVETSLKIIALWSRKQKKRIAGSRDILIVYFISGFSDPSRLDKPFLQAVDHGTLPPQCQLPVWSGEPRYTLIVINNSFSLRLHHNLQLVKVFIDVPPITNPTL